jgi:hypothetical protein
MPFALFFENFKLAGPAVKQIKIFLAVNEGLITGLKAAYACAGVMLCPKWQASQIQKPVCIIKPLQICMVYALL